MNIYPLYIQGTIVNDSAGNTQRGEGRGTLQLSDECRCKLAYY
jgi:hypothetical protein